MSGRRFPNTPHDAFFRGVFSRPKAVAIELHHVLPAHLSRHLDLDTLQLRPTAFVGPRLDLRQADLIYSMQLRGVDRPVAIGTVLEHLSSRDALMPWRAIDYMARTWGQFINAQQRPPQLLPFMLPILLAQRRAWTTPTRLSDILDLPPAVVNDFGSPIEVQMLIDDLSGSVLDDPGPNINDGATLALVEVTRMLLHAHGNPEALTAERLATLESLFITVDGSEPDDTEMIWSYIAAVFGADSPVAATFIEAIKKSEKRRDMLVSVGNSWFAEGRAEGRAESQREWLIDVLQQRALPLSAPVRDRILTTNDEQQLRRWFQRALAAASLDEVFLSTEPMAPGTQDT